MRKIKYISFGLAAIMLISLFTACTKESGGLDKQKASSKSAFDVAVASGYSGTQLEWLASLVGETGAPGESAYELAVKNGYTGTESEWLETLTGVAGAKGKSAYQLACENGFDGTLSQWLDSLVGPAGVKGATGERGPTGEKGVSGEKGEAGTAGKSAYEIACENGYSGSITEWLASLIGKDGSAVEKGDKGDMGVAGKSAYELAVDNGYTGTLQEWLASLVGAPGAKGAKGDAGKSAYELAVQKGYTGTEEQWLASLVGEKGAKGDAGKSAYALAVEKGYTGTELEWLASLVGAPGAKGAKGDAGKSAYELAVEKGYTGTLGEWLASLIGETGATGPAGAAGANGKSAYEHAVENGFSGTVEQWLASLVGAAGASGKSAYEHAVENGYTGTVEQWLTSLIGVAGPQGLQGPVGATGETGPQGPAGVAGPAGAAGTTGAKGEKGDKGDKGEPGATGAAGVGVSVIGAHVDASMHLILEMSDGSEIDAGYVGVPATYTVTFKDYDGTVLATRTGIASGGAAAAPADPTRFGYRFTGWDAPFTNITKDTIVTATYIQQFTVVFVDYNMTVLKTQTIDRGGNATPPANPTREGYTFSAWSGTYTNVTSNQTVTATYTKNPSDTFAVTFYDYDGETVLKKETNVASGANVAPPADPSKVGYIFAGWEGSFMNVTSNRDVTAKYVSSATRNIVKVQSVSGVKDDQVTVQLILTGDVYAAVYQFDITYDKNSLTYVGEGGGAAASNHIGPNTVKVSYFNTAGVNITTGHVIITLTFTVNTSGSKLAPITVSNVMFGDEDGNENIEYTVINGEVRVNL